MSSMSRDTQTRLVVVPIIKDEHDRVLLCKMPPDRGVFPNQWGLPGGGVEAGERMHEALAREVKEELGVSILEAKRFSLKMDCTRRVFRMEPSARFIWSSYSLNVASLRVRESV